MQNASLIERTILESNFSEHRFVNGYFEHDGDRTRDYAIVLRISVIGHHRPFGFVVSRSSDSSAPQDELLLSDLVGANDLTLKGATRVGEEAQELSSSVKIYSATGKELGDFDIPPLASFYIDDFNEVILSSAENGERFAQYFFCAPTQIWPKGAGQVFSLEGDGKFISDRQIYRYNSQQVPINLEIAPFSRYPERPQNQQLGPEMFHEPLANEMNLGEHSTKLILNAPQASLVFKTNNDQISDEEFSRHIESVTKSLQLVFFVYVRGAMLLAYTSRSTHR